EPATDNDLFFHVGMLLKAFPNEYADETFAQLLWDQIASLKPGRGQLEIGCQRLLRKHKFPRITIADVYEAVEQAGRVFESAARRFQKLQHAKDELAAAERKHEEARQREEDARQREIYLKACYDRGEKPEDMEERNWEFWKELRG